MRDLTRYKWVYILPSKESKYVFQKIEEWVKIVERETGCKVQHFRTDGGREYWGDLTPFLKHLGIQHKETPPYTPQSNGRAERLNRTLNEAARAMLIHANMPQQFWPEAVATAIYMWNRLPNSAINNKTPYELYYGEKPDLHHMQPFGCIVYAHVPKAHQGKESKYLTRAHKGVFVEYDSSESWRVYDLERRCFDVSHDVTFVETEFPRIEDFPQLGPAKLQNLGVGKTMFAPASVATDVPPVIHNMIVMEPPPTVQAMAMQSHVRLGPGRNTEPANYHDAITRMDADKWLKAMHAELQSLEDNNTWVLCELPPGRRVMGTKWVFKIKVDAMNILERYKARIVAQGFSQIAGLDFNET